MTTASMKQGSKGKWQQGHGARKEATAHLSTLLADVGQTLELKGLLALLLC